MVLSGIPNLLQSLIQRGNILPQAKYPPPSSQSHLSSPWYSLETSMILNGNAVNGINAVRRRPHSLIVAPDPSVIWDVNHRLSCSVFGSIPEQRQAEVIRSNQFSVSRYYLVRIVLANFIGHYKPGQIHTQCVLPM